MAITISLFAMVNIANAQSQQSGKSKPPQQALDACLNATAGQQCEFTGKRGQISGTCFSPADNLPLACKPEKKAGTKNKYRS